LDALKTEIKKVIISSLFLKNITPDDIKDDAPLFGEGLGLDSVDAMELIIAIEDKFDVKITQEDKDAFASVNALAEFIAAKTGEK